MDCSPSELIGELPTNGARGSGVYGQAISLSGTSISLGNPTVLQLTDTAFTVAAWFRIGALADTERPAILSKMGQSNDRGWELAIMNTAASRRLVFRVSPDNVVEPAAQSTQPMAAGTWTHAAGVYAPGWRLEVYVNGVLSGTGVAPSSAANSSVAVHIGGRSYDYGWRGMLDDVRIYGRALSAAEIGVLATK